jgi:hypothetical protein
MAALLKQAAEPRMVALDLIEGRERICRSLLLPLG